MTVEFAYLHPTVDDIMSKAQEFASAWSLLGSRFDHGDMLEEAERVKEELRALVKRVVDNA